MADPLFMPRPFETEERRAFRATIRGFTEREIRPHVNEWDEAGAFPWTLHQEVGALGVFGFGIDEAYGGLGYDDCFLRAIFAEEMAQGGSGGVLAGLGARSISTGPLQSLASEAIRRRVLPPVVSGERCSALAITEPSGGSDVAQMRTTARRDGDVYVLNGSKTFITSGMVSDFFVVGARTGGSGLEGISLFLVEADTPGFTRTSLGKKMGWWCSDQATLHFENCRIPAANLLGREHNGFLAIVNNFNLERVAIIAQALGTMKLCLTESIAWARERRTFGRQLIHHQVIRHKIADMSARIDAVQAYLDSICFWVNEGRMPAAEIAKAKFFSTKALEAVVSEAMQILGGAGYLRGHPVERAYREVKVLAIGGGSEEIMRDLAVRQMRL